MSTYSSAEQDAVKVNGPNFKFSQYEILEFYVIILKLYLSGLISIVSIFEIDIETS